MTPLGLAVATGDGRQEGLRVGTVDLQRVFASDAQLKDELGRIEARKTEEEAKVKKMREVYNELKMAFDSIGDQSNEKYVSAGAAVFAEEEKIKRYKLGIETWLRREVAERNVKAHDRYCDAIAKIAAARGIDMVLRVRDTDDDERELESRLHTADLATVLYHDAKLDITEDVIKYVKGK
jgi:Skp family chaperone for outer membrane proteins